MKLSWLMLFVALPVLAQSQSAQIPAAQAPMTMKQATAACGLNKMRFNVVRDKSKHTIEAARPGMARVIFVQDMGTNNPFGAGAAQITRVGMDGAWVGAMKDESWISVSVAPGEHHLCVTPQARFSGNFYELAHFTAEAGQDYYFRIRDLMWQTQRLEVGPADADQARYMIAAYPQSIFSRN